MKNSVSFIRPFCLQPISFKKKSLLPYRKIKHFFLSFEDAVICIFQNYNLKKDEYILMPNFFCLDTLETVSKYLKIVFYQINTDFTVDKESYFQQIKKYNPRVVWNYSFVGFNLTENEETKLKEFCGESKIIIEDFAHKILIRKMIKPINKHHFYIDSIRKHSSLLGAHLINDNFIYQNKNIQKINLYKIKIIFLKKIQNLLNILFYFFNLRFFYQLSEVLFIRMDNLIGKSKYGTLGSYISFYFYGLLDLVEIREHNKKLLITYNKYFQKLNHPLISTLDNTIIEKIDFIAYYPLFVNKKIRSQLEDFLVSKNIFISQLWEIEKNYYSDNLNKDLYESFLIFPLTTLVKEKDIKFIYNQVKKFLANNI